MAAPTVLAEAGAVQDVRRVAIVGSGSIGVAWAIVFAEAGLEVRFHEIDEMRSALAVSELESKLRGLSEAGVLTGSVDAALQRITFWPTLAEAVEGAGYVQECIAEDAEIKRQVFATLDELTDSAVVLASSSSAIVASRFAEGLAGRDRCLVVHPGNPPYFLRVAEVVPAPFTSDAATDVAMRLLRASGIAPILIHSEIEGFVFNRLQGALLREAYCLVRDGIVAPEDLDTLVRDGLGLRWSVLGPFATSELNTRGGLRHHARILGPVYARLGIERGADDPWTEQTVEKVAVAVERALPHASWEENVRARDGVMFSLLSARLGMQTLSSDGVRPATAARED